MSRLQVIRDGAFRRDAGLKAAIATIVATWFVDDVGQLEKEFERRDTLYFLQGEHGEVLRFFLVSWESLEINGRQVPALNAGLTAARPDQKGMGGPLRLYRHVVSEAQEWEQLHHQRLIVWGMTATPVVLFIARKVFANLQPSVDGMYSAESGQVARAVRRRVGASEISGSHPFVFRGLVAGVRYRAEERRRVAAVCRTTEFTWFDQLRIDEAVGDRLLFVADIPAER